MPTCAALKCARCYMLYAWPSHSICLHASPNASSCIPTVPTTGTDAHRVIWPSDAWSRAVCGYIVPEKYYEATRWQLYNQQEQQKKPQQCWRKSWSEAKTSPTFFPLFFVAQMASTVACHIVLPQGCAAADMEEKVYLWECLRVNSSARLYDEDSRCKRRRLSSWAFA